MSEITSFTFAPVDIWATDRRRVILAVTLASGTVFQAGDPIAQQTANGLYYLHAPTATDGTEVCQGFLTQNADTSSTGQNRSVPAGMAAHGELQNALLNRAAGATAKSIADLAARVIEASGRNILSF